MLPREDTPNVLIVLLDDVGFGASSTFGVALPDTDCGTTASTPPFSGRRMSQNENDHRHVGRPQAEPGLDLAPGTSLKVVTMAYGDDPHRAGLMPAGQFGGQTLPQRRCAFTPSVGFFRRTL
ncbi:MAG TPA: hypothetical protein VFP81_09665 [Propionibacteriaceae bacterium]|nr:hypothetical protein [Propionibacteriaceae bacterium]